MLMSCWDAVARTLADAGCDAVFGLPPDEPGLMDAAASKGRLTPYVVSDQRVAACAATGYALAAGRVAVLALDSGPSFANAMPGLLEASSLGAPLVVITTRVPGEHIGRGAFQHLDQRALVAGLAGWYHLVERPEQLCWAVRRAVLLAGEAHPGLVVIEVTAEVTGEQIRHTAGGPVRPHTFRPGDDELDAAVELLHQARRPVILAGGGARRATTGKSRIADLADTLGAPVFTTAAGRGSIDERHERAFGLVGLYTTPPAGELLDASDVMLVLGSRLEETARMRWEPQHRAIIQVDRSIHSLGQGCQPELALVGDVATTLDALLERLGARTPTPDREWSELQAQVAARQQIWVDESPRKSPVRAAIRALSTALVTPAAVVQENGLHDIWSYHYPVLEVGAETAVVCPGEQTMMGFGVAAAVGAALARPAGITVVFAGDSALRLSANALGVMHQHNCRVLLVIFDNAGFGWPRHLRRATGTSDVQTRLPELSWPELAAGYGGWAVDAEDPADLDSVLKEAVDRVAAGTFGMVRVRVPDSDVPVGVLDLLADGNDNTRGSQS